MYDDMPEMYDDTPEKYDNTPEKYSNTSEKHNDKPPLACLKQCYNNEDSCHRHDESQKCMMTCHECMVI